MDCMDAMKQFPNGYFDLAIVDPPYGISGSMGTPTRFARYGDIKSLNGTDIPPDYFNELFRISQNQIIWGYNHFSDRLPSCKEFIFWYKHQPIVTYADGELAWTSFNRSARCFDYPYFGATGRESDKTHPMQKPIALYAWLLNNYAKPGYKILDTHVGSGSSLIACYNAGFDYIGFEIDANYHALATERINSHTAQLRLID